MSDATGHEDRAKRPKVSPASVPAHLEPLIDLLSALIAEEKIKELQMDIGEYQKDEQIKRENAPRLRF